MVARREWIIRVNGEDAGITESGWTIGRLMAHIERRYPDAVSLEVVLASTCSHAGCSATIPDRSGPWCDDCRSYHMDYLKAPGVWAETTHCAGCVPAAVTVTAPMWIDCDDDGNKRFARPGEVGTVLGRLSDGSLLVAFANGASGFLDDGEYVELPE